MVIRLVSRATIEEGMLQHAQMKLRLEKDITDTGKTIIELGSIRHSLCSSGGGYAVDMASLLKQGLGLTSHNT